MCNSKELSKYINIQKGLIPTTDDENSNDTTYGNTTELLNV